MRIADFWPRAALVAAVAIAAPAGRAGADIVVQSQMISDVRSASVTDATHPSGYTPYDVNASDSGGSSSYADSAVATAAATSGRSTTSAGSIVLDLSASSRLTAAALASGTSAGDYSSTVDFTVNATGVYRLAGSYDVSFQGAYASGSDFAYAGFVFSDDTAGTSFSFSREDDGKGSIVSNGSMPDAVVLYAGHNYSLAGLVETYERLDSSSVDGSIAHTATANLTFTAVPAPPSIVLAAAPAAAALGLRLARRRRRA